METIQAHFLGNEITSNSAEAHALFRKSNFGELKNNKIKYSLVETMFLIEKSKLELLDRKLKKISKEQFLKKVTKLDKNFQSKYNVFSDLREKGYIVKTALKFGADFRVYDKGHKPGKQHAKWLVFTDIENNKITWHEFSAKNRVAHSTKKKLLLAIVDEEGDVLYYEVGWVKP